MPRRIPNPEGPLPALPVPIPDPGFRLPREPVPSELRLPVRLFRGLRGGCYLIRYTPAASGPAGLHYDGTMRVERENNNTTASGDLYRHGAQVWAIPLRPSSSGRLPLPGNLSLSLNREPKPANGIPILPRGEYRYYLRVTQILEGTTIANSFTLGFDMHRFTAATNSWTNDGNCKAVMTWTTAPPGYPSGSDYLRGDLTDSSGATMGTFTMGWVSPYLRRAVVEIDRVGVSETTLDNGAGVNWRTIFDQVGWDVTVAQSDADVVEPSGASWSDAEMHAAMLARRAMSNLDGEWRYHVLCVRLIDSTSRGIMYDAYATDSNNVPREGAGIASHWTIPNTATWGHVKGLRFGTATAPYFRTAVHELGHAMGLYHNTVDMGVMNTTDVIAASAVPPTQFPDNVKWSHAPDDQKRLRHMPDVWVRPGGIPFGNDYSTTPISPTDLLEEAYGLTLEVSPLCEIVPLGAPVRIQFALVNTTDQPLPAPANLRLRTGFVQGKVVDPSGTVRQFLPLVRCVDEQPLDMLEPGARIEHSATLLRGPQGALFPVAGPYRVVVEVDWEIEDVTVGVTGETAMMVSAPENQAHAEAALRILATPDALLTLALGGDHLPEGIAAIQTGLDDEVLRPHYAVVEARRLGTRFGTRDANLEAAADLLDERTVLSSAEIASVAGLVEASALRTESTKRVAGLLADKASEVGASDEVVMKVRAL